MRRAEKLFVALTFSALSLPLGFLGWLIVRLCLDAATRLDGRFLTAPPSHDAELAGLFPSLLGSAYLALLTVGMALPIGLGAAVYLEEYARPSRLTRLIELNIATLAGVPSIIYGLLGVELFVRALGAGRSLLAGALTLTLLLLPALVIVCRQALRSVPHGLREASLALGATKLETVRRVVLPLALPSMLTGVIAAVSRGIGEAAPLLAIGALTFVTFAPASLFSVFSAVPLQIFNWLGRPEAGFQHAAAAAIIVLVLLVLALNALAIWLRLRLLRRYGA